MEQIYALALIDILHFQQTSNHVNLQMASFVIVFILKFLYSKYNLIYLVLFILHRHFLYLES